MSFSRKNYDKEIHRDNFQKKLNEWTFAAEETNCIVCLFTFLFAVVSPGGGSVVEMGGRKQENGITREIQNVLHPNYHVG